MHIFMLVCNSVSVLFIICIIPFPYCITYVSQDVRICSVFYLLLIKTYVNEADTFLITSRSSLRKSIITSQLLTRPEHLSSHPVFSGVRVTRYLFYVYVLWIVVCPFVLFLLAIVLSVHLRFTDSDYLPLVSSNSS
jgi:hypothetical protein